MSEKIRLFLAAKTCLSPDLVVNSAIFNFVRISINLYELDIMTPFH